MPFYKDKNRRFDICWYSDSHEITPKLGKIVLSNSEKYLAQVFSHLGISHLEAVIFLVRYHISAKLLLTRFVSSDIAPD